MPIRRGTVFANPEGYYFCQSGGVLFLPIRRGLVFANPGGTIFTNPERSCFCQSGEVLFLLRIKWTEGNSFLKIVKGNRSLRDRLGTSDCTGNLPFIKDQAKTKQIRSRIFATLSLN